MRYSNMDENLVQKILLICDKTSCHFRELKFTIIDLKQLLVAWYKVKLDKNFDLNPFAIQAITEILQEKGIEVNPKSKEKKII